MAVRSPLDRCLQRVRGRDHSAHIPVSDDRMAEINERSAAVDLAWDVEIDNGGPASEEVILEAIRRVL